MNDAKNDDGVIQALLDRLNTQRLPQLLEIQKRVEKGEKLNELDMYHLEEVIVSSKQIGNLMERHPEYQALVSRVVSLYKEITEKALENEKNS